MIIHYIENGYYYVNGEKQYKAIIADNILSEVINHRGNVYKVKNSAQDAHEAIRPISLERTPEMVKPYLSSENYKLLRI